MQLVVIQSKIIVNVEGRETQSYKSKLKSVWLRMVLEKNEASSIFYTSNQNRLLIQIFYRNIKHLVYFSIDYTW